MGVEDYAVYYKAFHFITLIVLFFLRHYGLYRVEKLWTLAQEHVKIVKALTASVLVLMAISFFIRGFTFSRTFLVMAGLCVAIALGLERFLFSAVVVWGDEKRGSRRNVLFIGAKDHAKKLIQFFKKNPRFGSNRNRRGRCGCCTGSRCRCS